MSARSRGDTLPSEDDDKIILKLLQAALPESSLAPDCLDWAFHAARWTRTIRTYRDELNGWGRKDFSYDLQGSDLAVQKLIENRTPVTTNLLHLVAQKPDATAQSGAFYYWWGSAGQCRGTMGFRGDETVSAPVSFEHQRSAARAELKKRESPAYRPVAYLSSKRS